MKAYQVSYSIENEKTREREIRALQDLQKQFWDKIIEYNIIVYEDYELNKIDWINIVKFNDLTIKSLN